MQLFLHGILGDQPSHTSPTQCPANVDELANFILDNIQNIDYVEDEEGMTAAQLLQDMMTMQGQLDGNEPMGAMTASSSSTPSTLRMAAATTPLDMAGEIRDYVLEKLMSGAPEDREQSRREFVKHLLREAQTQAFNLRTMLSLLEDMLPQPNSPEITSQQVRSGSSLFMNMTTMLQRVIQPLPENSLRYGPIGMEEAAAQLAPLSSLAIEIMTFLEEGGDFDDNEDTNRTPEALRPEPEDDKTKSKSHGHVETQTTRATGSVNSSASSERPKDSETRDTNRTELPDDADARGEQSSLHNEGGTGNAITDTDLVNTRDGYGEMGKKGDTSKSSSQGSTEGSGSSTRPRKETKDLSKGKGRKESADSKKRKHDPRMEPKGKGPPKGDPGRDASGSILRFVK